MGEKLKNLLFGAEKVSSEITHKGLNPGYHPFAGPPLGKSPNLS